MRFSWEIASTNRSARIDPWGGNSFDLSLEASVPRNEIGSAALGAGPLRDATGVETPFKDLLASLDIAASDGGASAALREAAQRGQR